MNFGKDNRLYRDGLGESINLATYDQALWQAARAEGQILLPDSLP